MGGSVALAQGADGGRPSPTLCGRASSPAGGPATLPRCAQQASCSAHDGRIVCTVLLCGRYRMVRSAAGAVVLHAGEGPRVKGSARRPGGFPLKGAQGQKWLPAGPAAGRLISNKEEHVGAGCRVHALPGCCCSCSYILSECVRLERFVWWWQCPARLSRPGRWPVTEHRQHDSRWNPVVFDR